MKVYVLLDSTENTGAGSIIGIFKNEITAKLRLAEYVIDSKSPTYDYIEIEDFEVEE